MNNLYGLKSGDIQEIINRLQNINEVEEAIIFGSRAKGNYKTGSDVDIALRGEYLSEENITELGYWLNEESLMPYQFDIQNYHDIDNKDLTSHINRVGIVFYKREANKHS